MRRKFHVSAQVQPDDHLIVFRMTGPIDSRKLIERWIEVYSEIAEPWRFNRLMDYRRAEGIVDYDELARFAAWWRDRIGSIDVMSRVAIVVNNPLDLARVNTISHEFPRDVRRSFMTLDEALNWLNETS